MNCPFCNDNDFDLIGLKHHLSHGYCDAYNATLTFDTDATNVAKNGPPSKKQKRKNTLSKKLLLNMVSATIIAPCSIVGAKRRSQ